MINDRFKIIFSNLRSVRINVPLESHLLFEVQISLSLIAAMDSQHLDPEDPHPEDAIIGELYVIEFKLDPSASSRNFKQARRFLINLLQNYVNVHLGDEGINLHRYPFFFHEVSLWVLRLL